MFLRQVFSSRMVYAALLGCVSLLIIAPFTTANAQSQKDFSSSRDNSVYSNKDITGSLLVSEHNDQNNGYVSHDWWSMDRLTFEGGGGFIIPTGSARQYENMGWNIKAGGGYRLNDRFSAMLDYDYVSMGVPSAILNQVNPQGGAATHLWSLTINPIFNYISIGRWDGYVVGGGGFYRKVVNFTQPFNDQCAYYDPFYGCVPGTVNQTVAHFSNNAGGVDFGAGITHRFSDSGRTRLFFEGRYVWVDNQPSANNNASTGGYAPANYRTEYVPITVGIRF